MAEKKTFRQIAELWKTDKVKFVKLSTISAYSLILENHLFPTFGEKTSIVEKDVQEFVITKLQTLSRKTVQDLLIVLKMVYRYGVKLHFFAHEEWDIKFPTVRDKQEVEVLTIANQKRLLDHVRENFTFRNLGILLCLSTGMRIGEVCALTWQDIDLAKRVVKVSKTIERIYIVDGGQRHTEVIVSTPKTQNSRREIPLSPELYKLLVPLMKVVNRSFYILTNDRQPTEPRTYRNYYTRLLKQLDIPVIKFHGLRHSFATRCIESHCDYKTVSVILGHANIGTTLDLYVHPNLEQKQKCINRMFKSLR